VKIDRTGKVKDTADPGDVLELSFPSIHPSLGYALDSNRTKWIMLRAPGVLTFVTVLPAGIDFVSVFTAHSFTLGMFATETRSFSVNVGGDQLGAEASEHLAGFCS
jgi:hypothetical protein